jgi:hypothetical protein
MSEALAAAAEDRASTAKRESETLLVFILDVVPNSVPFNFHDTFPAPSYSMVNKYNDVLIQVSPVNATVPVPVAFATAVPL